MDLTAEDIMNSFSLFIIHLKKNIFLIYIVFFPYVLVEIWAAIISLQYSQLSYFSILCLEFIAILMTANWRVAKIISILFFIIDENTKVSKG